MCQAALPCNRTSYTASRVLSANIAAAEAVAAADFSDGNLVPDSTSVVAAAGGSPVHSGPGSPRPIYQTGGLEAEPPGDTHGSALMG